MAQLAGPLWQYNLCKVVVVDVSDDYRYMQPPMPSSFYPVLDERLMPRHNLTKQLPHRSLVEGYLYDWHETPADGDDIWYVGVVENGLSAS